MTELRTAKRRAALAIALADIGGLWDVNQVTAALTRFADACVQGALRFLLRADGGARRHGRTDGAALEATTGLTVLAMGKYGAFELNYSSDIDLVVFYDADEISLRQARRSARRGGGYRARAGQADRRDHGRRLCLPRRSAPAARCRRHPGRDLDRCGAGLLRSHGPELGTRRHDQGARLRRRSRRPARRFSPAIAPFIWRRYLDFAAIEDIQSIKRQIHAHAGHGEIAVAGHNIKLGRGGIREIEFFAQTQQLILGGRHPGLRAPATQARWTRWRREARVDARGGGRAEARLSLSAHAGTPAADDRGPADPYACPTARRAWPISPASWAMTSAAISAPR